MSSFWWTSLFVFIGIFAKAKCESTAFPVIPNHLLECYMDDGIYHRANRMPNTLESFLDLLRKVESSPTSRNMNARELATALLHYLKLDGIQSIQAHTKYHPSNILPFAPSGDEYFKHRLTLVGLVPRVDQSYMRAINESLTQKEMCNLHFMLSYSIDPYKRSDERCSPLFQETRKEFNGEPRSEWNPYSNGGAYYRRYRRHIQHGESPNGLEARNKKYEAGAKVLPEGSKTKRETKDSKDEKKLEVEEIAVPQHLSAQRKLNGEEKDKFTIGNQELLSEFHDRKGMQSLIQVGNFGRYSGSGYPKPVYSTDDSFYSGIIPGIPLSECPVVNGVIKTPYGSLTIGTVIAGIAAGLNPEEIPPVKLSVDPKELESPSDRLKNVWATTLAGTVADTLSSSALLDVDNLQVIKGGWNESSDPKWYLLSNNQFKHIPEVTLRGSLDGLILGVNAKEWTARFSGFKLSQMLQTYYRCRWGNVGAKHRVNLRSQYAPDEIFRKQVHLMSLVLKKQKTNVLTVLDYQQISNNAVRKVIQFIQMMDDNEKSSIGSFFSTMIDNSVNMIAVVDSTWGQENLYNIFTVSRRAEVALTMESKLTIVCGKDGRILTSADNSADFHNLFSKEMLYENCTRGMSLPVVFDSLERIYRKIYNDEKISEKMNTDAQVVVLFPYEPPPQDFSYVTEKSINFRNTFPDVRLMIASNGRPEGFLPMVENQKDLFGLTPSDPDGRSYSELAEGVKQSYQRISRPSCGSYFDDDSPGIETRVTKDVGIGDIVYYRLLPQYFYTQHGQAVVMIRSKQKAQLTVCHSREMERPVGPSPRGGPVPDYQPNRNPEYSQDFPPEASPYGRQYNGESEGEVECKTITTETYKIEMNNPCEGSSSLRECRPLYISLSPPHQDTISIICPNCRLPSDVQYEITVSGLTCYNSAAAKLLSPILFFFLLINYSLKYFN